MFLSYHVTKTSIYSLVSDLPWSRNEHILKRQDRPTTTMRAQECYHNSKTTYIQNNRCLMKPGQCGLHVGQLS